jgi:hypothetical protein
MNRVNDVCGVSVVLDAFLTEPSVREFAPSKRRRALTLDKAMANGSAMSFDDQAVCFAPGKLTCVMFPSPLSFVRSGWEIVYGALVFSSGHKSP